MDVFRMIQEIMSLTKTVGHLESLVDALGKDVHNHAERIVRLEQREPLLEERMANRVIVAVHEMSDRVWERLALLERRLPPPANERKCLSE